MKIKAFLSVLLATVAFPAFALIECQETKITGLKLTNVNATVKIGNTWHLVGKHFYEEAGKEDILNPITEKIYQSLLAYHLADKKVVLQFEGASYKCNLETFNAPMVGVRSN